MTKRGRILSFGSAGFLVVAGIAGAVAFSGTFGQVLALVLIGFGFVLATGLVFLEVGLSEDKERAREQQRRVAEERSAPVHAPQHQQQDSSRRLERMRGSRRRLR